MSTPNVTFEEKLNRVQEAFVAPPGSGGYPGFPGFPVLIKYDPTIPMGFQLVY